MLYSKQIITGNLKNELIGEGIRRAATISKRSVHRDQRHSAADPRFPVRFGVLSEIGTNGILVKGYDRTATCFPPSGIYVRADGAAASLSDLETYRPGAVRNQPAEGY